MSDKPTITRSACLKSYTALLMFFEMGLSVESKREKFYNQKQISIYFFISQWSTSCSHSCQIVRLKPQKSRATIQEAGNFVTVVARLMSKG